MLSSRTFSLLMLNCLIMILVGVLMLLMMMIDDARTADERILEQSSCPIFGPDNCLHIVGGRSRQSSVTLGLHDTGSGSG